MAKILILTWILLLLSPSSYSQEITVLTEDYKPFQYENKTGELVGFGVELVKKIFQGTSIKIKDDFIHIYPWARAYRNLQLQRNTAAFMTVRNKKREHLFKWVGPLAPRKMWLYKLKSRKDIQIKTLADAKRYRVGGYNQAADTNYMLEMGFDVDVIPSQRLITRMLVRGRMDLMSSLELTMVNRLRDLKLNHDVVEKTILLDGRYDYYLAFNILTSDLIVKKLQISLNKLKRNGTYDLLWKSYTE